MVVTLITVFILGYIVIACEHPLKINKSATALLLGTLTWVIYAVFNAMSGNFAEIDAYQDFLTHNPLEAAKEPLVSFRDFVGENLVMNLGETAEIVFFLLGAMTIVTLIEDYQGFRIITDKIKTTNKKRLLWILSILTFFLSALLDNMTTAIVMCALLSKLIADKKERWLYAGMVILAANAGGAWSPIGDVTTIMLWIGKQVTSVNIIVKTFFASLACMIVPVVIAGMSLKGDIQRPAEDKDENQIPLRFRKLMLIMGICGLIFVPIFKTFTHLPPYLGMLFSLAVLWMTSEIIHRKYPDHKLPTAVSTLEHVDVPTILFFLGILMTVSCLKVAGILGGLASGLDNAFGDMSIGQEPIGFFIIDLIIGMLSSVIDNVPLVAAAMGMYPIEGDVVTYAQNDPFWEFLAYCAGTGGSLLIIGSAAGVAVMGMEKIDFIWYLKRITLLAFAGYLVGALVFIGMDVLLFEEVDWLRNLNI
ncbi:MAG: sodium:proton antiporter NhaD [Bacteroidales bacterium]|nr:sodium:proton antiporter NhaD [Bacteroidales bacterium]